MNPYSLKDRVFNIALGCYWETHWAIKFYFFKAIGKKPMRFNDALCRWGDIYSPGNHGIYLSDGVYLSLSSHARSRGYVPLWLEQDSRGNDRYAYSGNFVGFFNHK